VRKHVAQHDGVVATDLLSELRRIAREGPITLVYSARDERAYMACSSAAERPVLKQTTVAYLSIAAEGPGSIALFDTRPRSAESLAARLRQHYPALRVAIRDNDPAGYDLLVNAMAASSRAIASSGTESLLTLCWRTMDSNFSYADAVNLVVALPSFTFADAVDLGKAEAERTADEAAQRPHQMLCLALAGLPGSCPNPGTRRRHARACPPRVCWPLCAWTIRATIRGARPYGLRCCHWDPGRNAHGEAGLTIRRRVPQGLSRRPRAFLLEVDPLMVAETDRKYSTSETSLGR